MRKIHSSIMRLECKVKEIKLIKTGASNVEVTGPKLTAGFDSRGGPRSKATTGARRTKLAVNLWSGAKTR